MILLHENENLYAVTPYCFSSATSSFHRRYESVAMSPVSPRLVVPGVCEKVSQMDGRRPSAAGEPSIW